jgi:hypothetical protein
MRKFLILLMFLVPLAACDGMLPKKQPAVPAWVLAPPNDSREWFWGVGEGQDLDAAKRAGLKDIAAKLRVSISGQLDSHVTVDNNKVDRQAHTRISEEVQKTEFSNYVVDKTAQSANGFFVLVKVDRLAFVRDLKAKLANLDATIQPVANALDSKTPLERFIALRRLQPGLDKGVGYAQLLIGAESANSGGGDGAAHLRNYESLRQQAKQALSGVVFQIQAHAEDADLAAAVATWLNESGIRTDPGQTRGGNLLAISSSSRNDEIYGSKMTKLTASLRVSDDQGRILASREFTSSGSSRYDYRGARQNAIQKMVTAMREAGPVTGLGFAE